MNRAPMTSKSAICVRSVSKHYLIFQKPPDRLKQMIVPRLQRLAGREPSRYYNEFSALNGVSFEVARGETVGIIGRNGCGKSTVLQIICGTLQPSVGEVRVNGRIAALLELGAGFNPEFTGRENVYMNGAILGLSQRELDERFDEIAAFADIGQFIEQPVKTYSSGMYVRLAFAVAINVDPDILVIDEALSVGDVAFQRKCFARLEQIRERGGTILFVSHSTGSIVELCDRAILLDGGELLLDGDPKRVTNQYLKLMNMPAEKLARAREKIRALQDLAEPEEEGGEEKKVAEKEGRIALRVGKPQEEETEEERERRLEEEEGWHDPNLQSQSKVEYESRGARIRDLRILAPSGRQVNVLKMGQRYTYEYYVDFEEEAQDVGFGMLIRSVSGLELAGAGMELRKDLRLSTVQEDHKARARLEFSANLLPGSYYLNAGVMAAQNGGRDYVHRLLDGLIFQIAPEKDLLATGMFDLQIAAHIQSGKDPETSAVE